MATATVIDDLITRFSVEKDVGIAYLYCNFRRGDEQKPDDLLASLIKQLVQRQSSLPDNVKALYHHHTRKQTRPSFEEVSKALTLIAAMYSRVFIAIDALDEYRGSNADWSRFLSEILKLQGNTGVNLFVTSRPIPEIIENFAESLSVEIHASNEDVARYLDSQIPHMPGIIGRSPHLHDEVKNEIIKSVQGMYVIERLHRVWEGANFY